MFDALTHSDLSAIHDLAVARARLDGQPARNTSAGERDAITARIFERITTLTADAQAELRALVRLGCDAVEGHADGDGDGRGGENGVGEGRGRARARDWRTLLAAARAPDDPFTPDRIASRMTLDECIERGLLVLGGRVC